MSGLRFPAICEYDASTWAMLYVDIGVGDDLNLATAAKADPHNWTAYGSNPILTPSSGNIRGCAVIKDPDDGNFKVLYDTEGQICLATGSTLESLTKYDAGDTPVFSGTGTGWEQYVRHPSLNKIGSTYHMYYDGRQGSATAGVGALGHATSSDLITWTRDTNNPVLNPIGSSWQSSDVGLPCLAQIDGVWFLFYTGYDGSGSPFPHSIGYAKTIDFSNFIQDTEPIIEPGSSGAWDDALVDAPALFTDGTDWFLYFSGRKVSTSADAIGYATKA